MGRLWFVVAACAAAAAPDASLSEVRSDCRKECKEVHRQLTPGKCRKLGRSLAREARAEASSACLAAFNRGLSDECEETCVASARGGAHPGPAVDRVYDAMGRPCTSRASWDSCRAGYEDAVSQTRSFFDFAGPAEPTRPARDEPPPAADVPPEPAKPTRTERREPEPEPPAYFKHAVQNVVTLTYLGEQVVLVLHDGETVVEVINAWCADHRPDGRPACARALNLLASAAARRNGGQL